MNHKTVLIINPASAGGKTGREFGALRHEIEQIFPQAEICLTRKPGHASHLAREYAVRDFHRIIGVGGDGTFNEIVNGLFIRQKPVAPGITLGTLPMGTGSDLIKTLKIPSDPANALRVLKANHRIKSDIGCLNLRDFNNHPIEKYFINLVTFGLGGLTCITVNKQSKKLGGRVAFFQGVVQALLRYRDKHIRIRGKKGSILFEGPVCNVALANGQYCGGGMHMAPPARMDTGQFYLIVFGATPRWQLLMNMPKLYWGGHMRHRNTRVETITGIEAIETADEDVFLEMDGETPGKLPLEASCLSGSLYLNTGAGYGNRQQYLL